MVCFVKLNVGVGGAEMPLAPVSVFAGSAATFVIEGVPAANGVSLSVVNAAGATMTVRARRNPGRRSEWAATFPDAHMAAAGRTERGVTVTAFGVDERGESVTWILGIGDIEFVPVDAAVMENLGAYTNLRLLEAELETPHRGDLVKRDGGWSIYNGTSWDAIDAVRSVNGKTGAVVLSASDVGALSSSGGRVSGPLNVALTAQFESAVFIKSGLAVEGPFNMTSGGRPYWVDMTLEKLRYFAMLDDMEAATRYLLTQISTSDAAIELAANGTKYVLLGGDTFGGSVLINPANDWIHGRVSDSVLLLMADRDTTVAYENFGGFITWLAADPSDVKTLKANTPTMFYFTQVRDKSSTESAVMVIGKAELQEVS